jgi:hypothetical protein
MPLTDSSRVGFITVNPDLTGSANYLPIADFNATQRSNWFSKLFSQVPADLLLPVRGWRVSVDTMPASRTASTVA